MVFKVLSLLLAWLGAALASAAKIPEGLLDVLSVDAQKMALIDREELQGGQREFSLASFVEDVAAVNEIDLGKFSVWDMIARSERHRIPNQNADAPYPTLVNVTSSIPVLNYAMGKFFNQIAAQISDPAFPAITPKEVDIKILTTSLTVQLDKLKVKEMTFDPQPDYIMKPLSGVETQLKVPAVDIKVTSNYKFVVKEAKKEPVTLTGDLVLTLSKYAIDMMIKSLVNDPKYPPPSVFYKVDKYGSSWSGFEITFSDPETEKIWKRLFDNKTAKQIILNVVVKSTFVDNIDDNDFSKLVDVTLFGTYNLTGGMSGHAVYPYYWPEQGGSQVRGFVLPMHLRFLDTKSGSMNPLVLKPDMAQQMINWDQMTVGLSADLFNTLLFGVFESDLLDVSINDKITHAVFPFNTDNIRFLFPNIGDKFSGNNSVILELKTHDYSPETTNFRTMNGRAAVFLEMDLNWYVYDNPTQDPAMTIKKCGSKCIKFVTLTTQISVTTAFGVDNYQQKVINLGGLNLDIGGLIVKDALFDISQQRLFEFLNGFIDSLMVVPPSIGFEKFLANYLTTVDVLKDQIINFEISPQKQEAEEDPLPEGN